jgi:HPr kinase/phosphorylase
MSSDDLLVHATAVASAANGVLILGPSGSGKSDLALRLIAWPSNGLDVPPFTLVSDDQVILARGPADCVEARPPTTIAGRLEVRGVGILAVHHTSVARVRLVIQLAPQSIRTERDNQSRTGPSRRPVEAACLTGTPRRRRVSTAATAGCTTPE